MTTIQNHDDASEASASDSIVSAGVTVAHTHELLEHILLSVDVETVLASIEVDGITLAIITSSPKLRRKLWFAPPVPCPGPSAAGDLSIPYHNPYFTLPSNIRAPRPFLIQPALAQDVRSYWLQEQPLKTIGINHTPTLAFDTVYANRSILDIEGIWEGMIIAQGPVTLHLRYDSKKETDPCGWLAAARALPRKIRCPVGTTAGQLVKAIRHTVLSWDGIDV